MTLANRLAHPSSAAGQQDDPCMYSDEFMTDSMRAVLQVLGFQDMRGLWIGRARGGRSGSAHKCSMPSQCRRHV